MHCPACQTRSDATALTAREQMLGYGDTFQYVQCTNCGALWLPEPPADLGRYYPENYYSFADATGTAPVEWLRKQRDEWAVWGKNLVGRLVYDVFPMTLLRAFHWAGKTNRATSVLDVGSGRGQDLRMLLRLGFTDLTGIDPFLPHDFLDEKERGLAIYKTDLWRWTGRHDVIIFNHALEHFAEPPADVLARAATLLRPGGVVIIRIPLADSWAFEQYETDWVQLDAPRHLFIPTRQAMNALAERSGLRVEKVVDDSTAIQFIGSEQYRQGIPLHDPRSFYGPNVAGVKKAVGPLQALRYARQAVALNRQGRGDQALFILRKP